MATWYSSDDGVTLKPLSRPTPAPRSRPRSTRPGRSTCRAPTTPRRPTRFSRSTRLPARELCCRPSPIPRTRRTARGGIAARRGDAEPGAITSPQIHLYGSSDGGASWGVLYASTIPTTQGYVEMYVDSVYPNGDVAVQVEGQGTVVLRLSGGSGGGGSPPVSSSLPVVSGSAVQGQVVSGSAGGWSGSPTSFAYQWRRCNAAGGSCVDIVSATASSYLVQGADVGFSLRLRVTASNGAGAGVPADSAATAVVVSGGGGGSVSFGATVAGASWRCRVRGTSSVLRTRFRLRGR